MTPVPSSPVALLDQLDQLRAKALTIRSAYPSLPVLEQKGADVEAVWSDGADMTWIECEEEADAALIVAAVNALDGLVTVVREMWNEHDGRTCCDRTGPSFDGVELCDTRQMIADSITAK